MAPSFYALLDGASWVGATLHLLAKGFDTGDILTQVKIPIHQDDTVYELNKKTAEAGGKMLMEFLNNCDSMNVVPVPQPEGNWRSYSYPTRADVRAFRRKGCRF
jgi:methionyl-tRNA formyltransferase